MKYNTRAEVELIGKTGACSYNDSIGQVPIIVSRQLSAFWVASNPDDDSISKHFKGDGFWEAWITLWVSRNVAPYSKCVNAGANYGYYTFMLAQHGCDVTAIEANPDLIPYLKKSVELNGCADRVEIINAAVADEGGRIVDLQLWNNSMNATIMDCTHTGDTHTGSVHVKSMKLDSLLELSNEWDFVFMDIEGAEQMAWTGMQELLKVCPDCVTVLEFIPTLYPQRGKLFFDELIKTCNISYITDDGNEESLPDFSFFDSDTRQMRMLVLRVRK